MFKKQTVLTLILALFLFACAPSTAGDGITTTRQVKDNDAVDEAILDKDWYLVEMNLGDEKIKIDGEVVSTFIHLSSEKNALGESFVVTGHGGCNGFGGEYAGISNAKIIFSNIISTQMACDLLNQENNFITLLLAGELQYELTGDQLLFHSGEAGLLTFSQEKPAQISEEYDPFSNLGESTTNIDPIIAQLPDATATFISHDSIFNELAQGDISDIWEVDVNGVTITVYAFPDAEQAAVMASTISPDGSMFTAPDGEMSIQVDFIAGTTPRYWLQDSYLILYYDNDEVTLQRLDNTFGVRVIDAGNPTSRHPEQPGQGMVGTTIEGISLQYDPYLAYEVSGGIVTEPDSSQYLLINLDSDNFPLIFPAQIQVSTRDTNLADWMPADTPHMEETPLTFQNGSGQRWVVQMGDGFGYFAEGKTDDGKYTVTLMFPVTTAKNGYIPGLTLLDAVFSSLNVTPTLQ